MIQALVLDQLPALLEARAAALLLARAASELPGVTAALHPGGIRLSAHRLRARLFGTRHRPRDPRLALFLRGRR